MVSIFLSLTLCLLPATFSPSLAFFFSSAASLFPSLPTSLLHNFPPHHSPLLLPPSPSLFLSPSLSLLPIPLSFSSWPEPCRAPAVVEGCDRRQRSRHGGQRHQTRKQQHRRRWQWRWRWLRPLHQQLLLNYLLLQPLQSITAHLPPFHRQRTVPRPQPQTREGKGKGTGKGAREVMHWNVSHTIRYSNEEEGREERR